jgi:hypothetical protein
MSPGGVRVVSSPGAGLLWFAVLAIIGGLVVASSGQPGEGAGSARSARGATSAGEILFIPAAAHVSGAADTDWRTDLEIFNPGAGMASYEISLLEKNQANPSPVTAGFSLVAGMAVRYDDILESVFGFTGSAGLKIEATTGEILAVSRTYNRTDEGTYGQFIGAALEGEAIGDGQEGRIIQLSHNRSGDSGFRTNVGFLNCTGSTAAVQVELRTSEGELLGSRSYSLGPFMFTQKDRIFEEVTTSDVADGYVVTRTTTTGGRFFAYASVVDNRTGDPIYIPAVAMDGGGAAEPVYIPAAAHVAGAAGTNWRTDLELHNPGASAAHYEIALLRRNRANPDPAVETFQVAAGHSLRLDDVLSAVFGFDGGAALRITPISGRVLATSRTYNLTDDGTYGQFIGGTPESTALSDQRAGALIELSHHLSPNSGYRTNIGFVNLANSAIEVRADLHRADGTLLGIESYVLQPHMHRQIDRVFGDVTSTEVPDGWIVVSTTDPDGRFFAYASVVDNSTGDPVCVPAIPMTSSPPSPTPTPTPGPSSVIEPYEIVDWFVSWLGAVPGTGDVPDLEGVVAQIQSDGLDSTLQMLAARDPGIVTWSEHHLEVDYSDGHVLADGTVLTGQVSIDFPFASVTGEQVNVNYTCQTTNLGIDGRPLPIDTATGWFQLAVDQDGHAAGAWMISGTGETGTAEFTNTVDGVLGIDTETCPTYPMAGSVTFELEDGRHTFTFGAECDGTFSYTGPAGTGDLAFRLRWQGIQDLDLHVREPNGEEIWFADPLSSTGGILDVDSNRACTSQAQQPTENIFWPLGQAPSGQYEYWAVLYSDCGASPTPDFTLSVLEGGEVVSEIHGTIDGSTSPHYHHDY